MRSIVKNVISDTMIELEDPWTFHGMNGYRVRVVGLIPSQKNALMKAKDDLAQLIEGKMITIDEFLFVSGDALYGVILYDGKPLQDYFTERRIPALEPSRWIEPDEKEPIAKVFGGIPVSWQNPIANLPLEKAPFLGNIRYPVKKWEKSYAKEKKLAEALYSDSQHNKLQLDKWFNIFLKNPPREAPLIIVGRVGVGKSWWIAHELMHLDNEKYHAMVIDLRYPLRGAELLKSILLEINEYLNHFVSNLSWLYSEFESVYKELFDPEDLEIKREMIKTALSIKDPYERIQKKLRFYDRPGAPELIIAFDNIDHFNEEEQLTVLDMCRRVVGYSSGVKTIVTVRPTTRLPVDRCGLYFGDAISNPVTLKSPDIYEVLSRRLSTNYKGDKISPTTRIPGARITFGELLEIYQKSDSTWGLANLIKELCSSQILPVGANGRPVADRTSPKDASYDIRHYLKLFRRVLRSNVLGDLRNIGNIYFGIHALLLAGKEPLTQTDAYLFNLFDNEQPYMRGNALVRYRVLEYCQLFNDLGEIFDKYFQALGCSLASARSLVDLFADAGLIEVDYVQDESGKKIQSYADITIAGRRQMEVITNLWYIICIKTGMNIFTKHVLNGDEAKAKASEFVTSEKILDYYAEHGWVSEDGFIEFLGMQELLEYRRIGYFQESNPDWREQIANMTESISHPVQNIYWSYKFQKEYWQRSHKGI